MSQHMYEAAEADLVKAVADEENAVRPTKRIASGRNRRKTGVKGEEGLGCSCAAHQRSKVMVQCLDRF